MTTIKRVDQADRLPERTQQILAETQVAVDEANRAIKRTQDRIRRTRELSKADADIAHLLDRVRS